MWILELYQKGNHLELFKGAHLGSQGKGDQTQASRGNQGSFFNPEWLANTVMVKKEEREVASVCWFHGFE